MEMEFCNDSHENTLTFHHVPEIQLDEMVPKLHLKIGSWKVHYEKDADLVHLTGLDKESSAALAD